MVMIVVRQLCFKLFQAGESRKALAAFVFLCMLINGFTPRSEEGRNSLIMIMACTVQNAVSEVFVSCNEALTTVSNKITAEIYGLLMGEGVKTTAPVKGESKKGADPVNTTSDNGITVEKRTGTGISYSKEETSIGYISYIETHKLYRLYENVKDNCCGSMLGLLSFIVFIILTIRRKEISEIIKKGYKSPVLV